MVFIFYISIYDKILSEYTFYWVRTRLTGANMIKWDWRCNRLDTILEFICIDMDNGGKFPVRYTGRGQDISPEFAIKNLSSDAKSLAITLEDISHPIKNFTHWLIWNIPATDRVKGKIPAGLWTVN